MPGTDEFGNAIVQAEDQSDGFGVVSEFPDLDITDSDEEEGAGGGSGSGSGHFHGSAPLHGSTDTHGPASFHGSIDAHGSTHFTGSTASHGPAQVTGHSQEHPPVPVVDGSGHVVGTAVWDAALGQYVSDVVESTVVEEHSSTEGVSVSTGGMSSFTPEVSPSTTDASGGSPTTPTTDGGDGQSLAPEEVVVTPGADPSIWKYFATDKALVTECHQLGITFRTLAGPRTILFSLRFEATKRTPHGAPVSAEMLQHKTAEAVSRILTKYGEELPIVMSVPPFSLLGSLESLSDAVVSPIVARLVAGSLREDFHASDQGERLNVEVCGTM